MSKAGAGWRAAYRLQLRPEFDFDDAAAVVPYLADLGVSHLYLSPIVEAASGSEHGYDVVDHGRIRAELGGREGFDRLVGAAHDHGLGILLDIVPNHMAVSGPDSMNRWWWDVLKHGPASRYADWFDIAWDDMPGHRVLLPLLDDHLARVLDAGRIRVVRDDHGFEARFEDHRCPIDPTTVVDIIGAAAAVAGDTVLAVLADALRTAAPDRPADAARAELAVQRHLAATPAAAAAVDAALRAQASSPGQIAHLLARQHWRLARWQIANREIGYRRFFDVAELAALRTDAGPVFDAVHQLPVGLARGGQIDGLRIDHPDGLRDPEAYLGQLAERLPDTPLWVEKILGPDEPLRSAWPVEGTTGYDFLNLVTELFVDSAGAAALQKWFAAETGAAPFDEEAGACKRLAIDGLLSADLDRVTAIAARVCEAGGWDASRRELRIVLAELAAALPYYRTYIRAGHLADQRDRALIGDAAGAVLRRRPDVDRELVMALTRVLADAATPDAVELSARFQQLTTTAAAKGVEDTACYRWTPLAALCEVGGRPDSTGVSIESFHKAVLEDAGRWPHRLLDTSTHDTKRSEDVRARLALLSEDPSGWQEAVARLRASVAARTGPWPDARLELLAFQTAVGAWPIDADRLSAYLEKAAREAKLHTGWLHPDTAYEDAVARWASALVSSPTLAEVAEPLVELGRANSLGQVALKLTCPGVPVLYQGTETWDLSLVDPDNRRPVTFSPQQTPKYELVRRALDLRARVPECLDGAASYEPLWADGPAADHALAFVRGARVAVVVSRLVQTLARDGGWSSTRVPLPPGTWTDVRTAATWSASLPLVDVLESSPVALLVRQ